MSGTPYAGPGIWIRIQHRFGPRMMEWFLAGHTALWGYVLLMPSRLFEQSEWSIFRAVFRSEDLLGWLMVCLGILRIVGLIVNGARKHVTPSIRQVSAAIGCLIWVGISYCYASSNVVSTWLAIYPLFAVGELVNIKRAAHDEREARNGKSG
ncbi:hypothetical protein ASC97_04360 [Rhizobium sp. Root1203]|uniref:hypothetical protein n=1 Tax=Rhizobium sp. Root1203 TaxID=1736427 RepID=UPI00070BE245|nr:hypothetical protein [Rhizobium sp. Root1203]KQV27615.1 hypothetical protein ASC97_04360 [Rhizobium sp. Root1203]